MSQSWGNGGTGHGDGKGREMVKRKLWGVGWEDEGRRKDGEVNGKREGCDRAMGKLSDGDGTGREGRG